MVLLLREADVRPLITVAEAIDLLDAAFRDWAAGGADNQPRRRVAGGVVLATMSAALPTRGIVGFKAYTHHRHDARFWVQLFDASSGELVGIVEGDHLGRVRTGAASGLATRYLARPDARRLTIFGAGTQALTQVLAIASVRPLQEVRVLSRDPGRRERLLTDLAANGIRATAGGDPREAVEAADIITTITSAGSPLFPGAWLRPGQHLNVAGSNWPQRREVDGETVSRAGLVVADDASAARVEAGDLLLAEADGMLDWARVHSLREVIVGTAK
ncbi:MAG TPA: ornithine cyclodeaminase family protein, partial [Candidatus Limnocylindria bacterium]|nr:ornithine cyclodeaminase family protein [Candidatus Limnocylindria bacterium]